jgi:uncharacterized membrane protein (DUF2068 family)
MDTHIKVIGWLWIVLGALGVLGALCLSAATAGGGLLSEDTTALFITSTVALVCGGLFFLGSALNIIAGIGLLRYRSWARILVIILAIINLPNFPVGTALGIYTLWAMFNAEGKELFES